MNPFHIAVRRKRPGQPWQPLAEVEAEPGRPALLPEGEASESDELRVRVSPTLDDPGLALRLRVGSVLAASSVAADRVLPFSHDDVDGEGVAPLSCKGRLLADWVGVTELTLEARPGDSESFSPLLRLPLAVTAGKIETEQFNQLFAELERDAAAVLLDVHGKTQVGLKAAGPLASSAPVAMLSRIGATAQELDGLLRQVARQPASRLRVQRSRELALFGQAITEATLAEACRDPDMLARKGSRVAFREHLREHSRPDYDVPEHQAIADFGEFLKAQLADLTGRIDAEIDDREGRRRWRDVPKEAGQASWWESEDQPRIEELRRCRDRVATLRGLVEGWGRLPFLPPGRGLSQRPQSTPVFRNNPVYRRVFRAIAGHFLAYQATLDTQQMMTQARSLPVLYEWWCAVRVARVLARRLTPLGDDGRSRPLLSMQSVKGVRLAQELRRFTIEFTSDQAIEFGDGRGARVRFRYQPRYDAGGGAVAVLGPGTLRTPDLALEVYAEGEAVPGLIVVLDAKYSSMPQADKMAEVTTKYSKIGDARTGRVLSRQVWALTPRGPERASGEGLRRYCTVDNRGFWSEGYDLAHPVNGAIQARPAAAGAYDPLEALVAGLLARAGVTLAEA